MIKLRPRPATRPAKPAIPFSQALLDRNLLGAALGSPSPWSNWLAILKAAFAEPLSEDELAIFAKLSGGRSPPTQRVSEFWAIAGRRGGKSRMAAAIATFLACFIDYKNVLARGEKGYVLTLSPTILQAKLVLSYCEAFLESSPILRQKIEAVTATEIRLRDGIVISSHPSSFKSVRGRTILAAILDECAFFPTEESSLPDVELVRAVTPALATTRGMLIGISSPYRRTGVLHARFKTYFGKNDPYVLVIRAKTEQLNPTIDRSVIQRAHADDPVAAASEWNAEWRDDLASFVSREIVETCVLPGCFERPPVPGVHYVAFVDPSGGSSDSMTLAIGHKDQAKDTVILDAIREVKPPFSPEAVVQEFAALLKSYGVHTVTGDRYAGAWPVEQFSKFAVLYQHSEKAKSDLYLDALALLNSARIDLLDHSKLITQFCSLERRSARSGRDSIDHPPGAHDDIANAVAGLASLVASKHGSYDASYRWVSGSGVDDQQEAARAWRMARLMQHIANHNW